MNKEQKSKEITTLTSKIEKAKALIFADYRGLKVSAITDLRMKLGKNQSKLKVVKNRLMKRALKDRGLDMLAPFFVDPTAVASSDADPVAPAKILVEFAKTNDKLKIKGGFVDGSPVTIAQIEALAKLPSKEVMLSRVLASMQAPATNLACLLKALPRNLVYALDAIKEKKQ